ncbi:MAG TPA: ABC transporter permease [Vicinamibacteria bacterium]|nr:ABC transporter permease [Vicinamibacteria bacterium]
MQRIGLEFGYAVRSLARSPGFTAVAVSTLALGIGAHTAIFSVVDWLILRPLPVAAPEELHFLAFPDGGGNLDLQFSHAELREIRDGTREIASHAAGIVFGGVAGGQPGPDGLTVDGETRPAQTAFVSGDFFPMLGISPHLGRLVLPVEGAVPDADPVVVLSYRYWESRFAGDPSVVGKKAAVNGRPVTIVGVGPRGFLGVTPIMEMEAYLPLGMISVDTGSADLVTNPRARALTVVLRLEGGGHLDRAQASLGLLGRRLLEETPRRTTTSALRAVPLRPPGIVTGSNPLPRLAGLLLTLGGVVLLLASLNVANLALVRALGRQREWAVRSALGAPRSALVRQLLAETLLLALAGGASGIVVSRFACDLLSRVPAPGQLVLAPDLHFDARTLAWTVASAFAVGLFVGLVPALRVSRTPLGGRLHDGGRSATDGRQRLRAVLVAAQVAGSLTLLVAAGLFVRSLRGAQRAELGFDPQGVVNLTLDPHQIGYGPAAGLAFYRDALERVRALPGVQSASLARSVPLQDNLSGDGVFVPGRPTPAGQSPPSITYDAVSTGYFATMGIPVLQGRDLAESDGEEGARVAVVNEAMAARLWPAGDAVGRTFVRSSDPRRAVRVVGVVGNTRLWSLSGPWEPAFYVPLAQAYSPAATLQARTGLGPDAIVREARRAVASLASTMPVLNVCTMTRALHGMNGLLLFELAAGVGAGLSALGLVLALIGVYGVMAYAVSQRTREIGIRMALGARPRQLLEAVGRHALVVVASGIVLGLLGALAVSTLIGDFLVDVTPTDPLTYAAAALLLAGVALLAALVPARRATRVDPTVALRCE